MIQIRLFCTYSGLKKVFAKKTCFKKFIVKQIIGSLLEYLKNELIFHIGILFQKSRRKSGLGIFVACGKSIGMQFTLLIEEERRY